jgi:hypothetical protein
LCPLAVVGFGDFLISYSSPGTRPFRPTTDQSSVATACI